jgi:ribosomal protein S18 acetylase RimI-like enzyme
MSERDLTEAQNLLSILPATGTLRRIGDNATVTITAATLADVPQLAALETARLVETVPPRERSRKGFIVTALGAEKFAQIIETDPSLVLVARVSELDGPPFAVGFAVLYSAERALELYPYLELFLNEGSQWIYLKSIAVDPHYEGRGVSWKLFRALSRAARARSAQTLYTEVSLSPPNLPSLSLIKAGGLELIAEIPDPVKGFVWGLYRYELDRVGDTDGN